VLTLVGLSGTGKSTVARLLAERWGWTCADLDQRVEAQAGRTIPEIFAAEGEPAFRSMESNELRQALATNESVVAAGGGAPCEPGAMDAILGAGPVVWLSAEATVLADRVTQSEERPLLQIADPDAVIAHLSVQLEQRREVYSRAPYSLDTTGLPPEAVVQAIEELLQAEGGGPWAS